MAECLIANGQEDQARQMLAELTDEQRKDPGIASLVTRMAQAEEVAKLGDPAALEARLAANPDDHAARRDLAKILSVKGDRAAAAEHLLAIMRKDRRMGGRRRAKSAPGAVRGLGTERSGHACRAAEAVVDPLLLRPAQRALST